MVVHIESQEKQELLGRTRVIANASFDGATPKKADIRNQIATAAKVKLEQVIVKHIYAGYGKHSAQVEAMIYDKAEDAAGLEHKKLVEKHAIKKEEPKEEEKPAEETKAPSEEAQNASEEVKEE